MKNLYKSTYNNTCVAFSQLSAYRDSECVVQSQFELLYGVPDRARKVTKLILEVLGKLEPFADIHF